MTGGPLSTKPGKLQGQDIPPRNPLGAYYSREIRNLQVTKPRHSGISWHLSRHYNKLAGNFTHPNRPTKKDQLLIGPSTRLPRPTNSAMTPRTWNMYYYFVMTAISKNRLVVVLLAVLLILFSALAVFRPPANHHPYMIIEAPEIRPLESIISS